MKIWVIVVRDLMDTNEDVRVVSSGFRSLNDARKYIQDMYQIEPTDWITNERVECLVRDILLNIEEVSVDLETK